MHHSLYIYLQFHLFYYLKGMKYRGVCLCHRRRPTTCKAIHQLTEWIFWKRILKNLYRIRISKQREKLSLSEKLHHAVASRCFSSIFCFFFYSIEEDKDGRFCFWSQLAPQVHVGFVFKIWLIKKWWRSDDFFYSWILQLLVDIYIPYPYTMHALFTSCTFYRCNNKSEFYINLQYLQYNNCVCIFVISQVDTRFPLWFIASVRSE